MIHDNKAIRAVIIIGPLDQGKIVPFGKGAEGVNLARFDVEAKTVIDAV